jgi:hypothetical protein
MLVFCCTVCCTPFFVGLLQHCVFRYRRNCVGGERLGRRAALRKTALGVLLKSLRRQRTRLAIIEGPHKLAFSLKHYDRDIFTYETEGENTTGATGVTFTIRADGKATTVVVENLNVRGEGMFKRVAAVQSSSNTTPPDAATSEFAGLVDIASGRKMYLECRGAGTPNYDFRVGLSQYQ